MKFYIDWQLFFGSLIITIATMLISLGVLALFVGCVWYISVIIIIVGVGLLVGDSIEYGDRSKHGTQTQNKHNS